MDFGDFHMAIPQKNKNDVQRMFLQLMGSALDHHRLCTDASVRAGYLY